MQSFGRMPHVQVPLSKRQCVRIRQRSNHTTDGADANGARQTATSRGVSEMLSWVVFAMRCDQQTESKSNRTAKRSPRIAPNASGGAWTGIESSGGRTQQRGGNAFGERSQSINPTRNPMATKVKAKPKRKPATSKPRTAAPEAERISFAQPQPGPVARRRRKLGRWKTREVYRDEAGEPST